MDLWLKLETQQEQEPVVQVYLILRPNFLTPRTSEEQFSMARKGHDVNTANSQFFIMFKPGSFLDGQYTVWGEVIEGMQFVDSIVRGEPPQNPDTIIKMQVAADAQ